MSREVGIVYLLSNFLQRNGAEAVQLRCDGAQKTCARDVVSGGYRTPFTCSQCTSEQGALARWAGIKSRALSSFLSSQDISQSSAWLSAVRGEDLFRAEFRGSNLWEACRSQFLTRWELEGGQEITSEQEENLRDLYTAYVHIRIATERYADSVKPTLHFVVDPEDAASQAYVSQARVYGGECALFSYQEADETVCVETSTSEHRYETRLLLEGITAMRSEPRTWAPEVTSTVHEILSFLGYAPDRAL